MMPPAFLTYLVLDQFFAWGFIAEDILERPYILIGFSAFLLLIPLAATFTNAMVKRMGGRRWQKLHKAVYAIASLGVLHYFLGIKADISLPLFYGFVLALLLGYRWVQSKRKSVRSIPPSPA